MGDLGADIPDRKIFIAGWQPSPLTRVWRRLIGIISVADSDCRVNAGGSTPRIEHVQACPCSERPCVSVGWRRWTSPFPWLASCVGHIDNLDLITRCSGHPWQWSGACGQRWPWLPVLSALSRNRIIENLDVCNAVKRDVCRLAGHHDPEIRVFVGHNPAQKALSTDVGD